MPASASDRNLPALARAAIADALGVAHPAPPAVEAAWQRQGASFVTLTRQGALRGCIGTLEAWRPLVEDVRHNAIAAALHDPRFPPLTANELPSVAVEVSVLTSPTPLPVMDHEQLIATLRPQVDGVIVSSRQGLRATFLPQVWEQLPDAERFLQQLKLKAGLPADSDDSLLQYSIYQVDQYEEII